MKWLVVCSSLRSRNGYGALCRSVTEALGSFPGVELEVFTGDRARSWLPGRESLKSERAASYPRLWFLFAFFDFLALALAARGRYQGVLVLVEHYAAAGWLFSRWRKIPFVTVQCGTYAVKLPHDIPFYKRVLERADRVLPISAYTRKRMEEEGIRAEYTVVPLGVDADRFRPREGAARRPEVLFVGNLKARKGIDFLLQGMAAARPRVPEAVLKVVGGLDRGSPAFAAIQARISELGIAAEFTGSISEAQLVEAYATARLNALPSKSERFFFEGFGLIHLEANACGTLTVGALDSGNEDAIRPGCGDLIRYGDVQALADCIVAALKADPYPRVPYRGVRTWKDVAAEYAAVLAEVSATAARRRIPAASGVPSERAAHPRPGRDP